MSNLEKTELIHEKKGKILESLLIEKFFKEEGVIIRKWEGEANTKDYISEIKKGDIHFIGALDSNLVKQGYGFMSLPNNEKYFGVYTDDLRSKHGIYQYPDKVEGNKIEREFFLMFLMKEMLIIEVYIYGLLKIKMFLCLILLKMLILVVL